MPILHRPLFPWPASKAAEDINDGPQHPERHNEVEGRGWALQLWLRPSYRLWAQGLRASVERGRGDRKSLSLWRLHLCVSFPPRLTLRHKLLCERRLRRFGKCDEGGVERKAWLHPTYGSVTGRLPFFSPKLCAPIWVSFDGRSTSSSFMYFDYSLCYLPWYIIQHLAMSCLY